MFFFVLNLYYAEPHKNRNRRKNKGLTREAKEQLQERLSLEMVFNNSVIDNSDALIKEKLSVSQQKSEKLHRSVGHTCGLCCTSCLGCCSVLGYFNLF